MGVSTLHWFQMNQTSGDTILILQVPHVICGRTYIYLQAREDKDKPGLVAMLQKVLQLYASRVLSRRSYAKKGCIN